MFNIQNEFNELFKDAWYLTSDMQKNNAYPPYNIIELSEYEVVLELAVAGFCENEIDIQVDGSAVIISAKKDDKDEVAKYLHRGIATRSFLKKFRISKETEVTKAEYSDGILSVFLKQNRPKKESPKKIEIYRGERVYLTERDDIV